MRLVKEFRILAVFIVTAISVSNAVAVPTEILPESSHYQGSTSYYVTTASGILSGRIDFAVYDDPDEFIGAGPGYEALEDSEYIYAYQIFNSGGFYNEAVAYFAILGIEGAPVDNIGWQDDSMGGVEPTDAYFTASEGVWEFEGGILYAGENSYFLVLTSDTDWVPGKYEIRGAGFPTPEVPEPGMLILLGIGGALMFKRTRKSV